MSRNGAGVYTPPVTSFPAVANTLIESAKYNNLINDIAAALSSSVANDGQTPILANLPMGGFKLTGLGAGSNPGDSAQFGQFNAAGGAALVGYHPAGVGALTKTVQDRFVVNVNDYVTGGLGTSASPWTGWDTAITWSANTQYDFLDGYYSYATSPNFAKDFLCLNGRSGTVIRHTGTGYAMVVDAGSTTQWNISIDIRVNLEGNAGSSGGLYQRACVHSNFKIKFHNVPLICCTDIAGILNTYTLEHTGLVTGLTITPTTLISIDKRGTSDLSSANKYYLIAESCSNVAVSLVNCVNSQFIGGTSESNGGGYSISATSNFNTFLNIDLEVNTSYDISCSGNYNNFIGVLSTTVSTFNGARNIINGGVYNTINSGGAGNSFGPLSYSSSAGGFYDTGTLTAKRSVFNMTGSAFDTDLLPNTISQVSANTLSVTSNILFNTAAIIGSTSFVDGKVLAKFNDSGNLGASHSFLNTNGTQGNVANCGLKVSANATNSRSINAGGTVNASGADYAEYEKNNGLSINKGDIVGFKSDGTLTLTFSEAVRFGVKSTNPSYVGGDTWGQEDYTLKVPIEPKEDADQEEKDIYSAELLAFNAELETRRKAHDRIAYSGKVPVNVQGATPGDYIIAVADSDGSISGEVVIDPDFSQYKKTIGRVNRILPDGRCEVAVIIH